ncbi:4'-phosphopantetheinyl transferase family protein [Kitasatospora camelliae]|uniref:4'-phosphopantetheinyl transferase superfamily protein n=1 Tax=Kitasatospora camelliae TaxID=3156397 RepID=A0AAU8JWL4_9ACTN
MIERILPPGVISRSGTADPPDARLLPAEQALLQDCVPERRREFTTTRHLARGALAELGHPGAPLLTGPRGEPRWPAGVVGSLTHCAGYRAVAVAPRSAYAAVGVDAEPARPLGPGLLRAVARPEELPMLAELTGHAGHVPWDVVLFSAKESVYKAWYPLTGRWLGFQGARLDLHPDGVFTARVLDPGEGGPDRFTGRWTAGDGRVATAVTVPAG